MPEPEIITRKGKVVSVTSPSRFIRKMMERALFTRRHGKGSHTIFHMANVDEIVNIQPLGNEAKAYQVKQVRDLILKYQFDIH